MAQTLNNLATVYRFQGKYAQAEALYQRALAIKEKALGPAHSDVGVILDNLAILRGASGNAGQALAFSRRATAAVIAHAAAEAPAAGQRQGAGGLIEERASYFRHHVANLAGAARQRIEPEPALGREALGIAQWAVQSSAASALQQMAARFSGSGALGTLIRETQDLSARWRGRNTALIEAVSKRDGQRSPAAIDTVRREMADIETKLAANAVRLEQEFPDYAALANPKPLKAEDAQALLAADEALVLLLPGDQESYVFALTREGFEWKTLPIDEDILIGKVTRFRRGLHDFNDQVIELRKTGRTPELFDIAMAQELYAALLDPVEALIKDKRHLLVAPSGPLTALPFHLLVTEKPAVARPEIKDVAAYRDAAWLIKRHAITVLPSVASLKALRVFARKDQAGKPLIGFGDPVFDPAERAQALADQRGKVIRVAAQTRAYSEFWQGAGIDRVNLSKSLPSLLDSATELKAVARSSVRQQATSFSTRRRPRRTSSASRSPTTEWCISRPTALWRATSRASASPRWR